MLKLGFIGAGTVGTALAVRLNAQGYQIVAVASRSRTSAERFNKYTGCSDSISSLPSVDISAEPEV